jgi:hypothetical protein
VTSPFGKYGAILASFTGAAIILAALAVHVLPGLADIPDKSWIDNAALLVIGILFGTRAGQNGAGIVAKAAHERLDKIHAPAADSSIS